MRITINRKILTAILIPILLIPMAGYTYAHLTDTVIKRYKLHVVCGKINIESYKVYSPYDDKNISRDLVDDTIFISATVFKGWFVWVGFVVKNNGIFAMNVTGLTYQVTGNNVTWNATGFYYGPYKEAGFNPRVWSAITGANYQNKLDPHEGVIDVESATPPITLEPPPASHNKCKLIVWIYLEILSAPSGGSYTKISISPNAIMVDPLVEGP